MVGVMKLQTTTISISGMACGGCANTIKQALLGLNGVMSAEVSHSEGRAEVSYDDTKIQPANMYAAIEAAGYQVAR